MERINRKLKILYTIPNFNTAGSGKVLYDLAKGLDTTKFEVHIACSHNKGAFFSEIEKLGIPIHFIETTCAIRPYYNLLSRLKSFKSFVKQNQFDIVHSWNWSSDWTEVLATRLAGAKYIYTKKAMTWGNIHWKIKSFLADYIVTINEEMKNYFSYKKAQKLIPIGLDMSFYNPDLFSKKSNTTFKVITVANLVPIKEIEVLINAVNTIKNCPIHLDIVGDDSTSYANELKKLVQDLNCDHKVSFLGKHIDVRPFLSNANLYVMPSKNEGLGMALIEAMTMKLPVLGSNISGINFVLKDFPEYLFEVSNVEMLSQKIEEMCSKSEEELAKIGTKLREYCIQHFSLDKFIKEHEDLYQEIAHK